MVKRNRKILLVSSSFPSSAEYLINKKKGGADFLLNEVLTFQKAGFRIEIITPVKKDLPTREEISENVIVNRFSYPLMKKSHSYYHRPVHFKNFWLTKLALISMALAFVFVIFKSCIKDKPNVIWGNWMQSGLLAALATWWAKIPLMSTIRGSDIRNYGEAHRKILAHFCPYIWNVYPADKEIKSWITSYGFKEIDICGTYEGKLIQRKTSDDQFNFVVIGRLNGEDKMYRLKGLGDPLFHIFKEVLAANPKAKLKVVGSGYRLDEYKEVLKNFSDRVTFTGWLTDYSEHLYDANLIIGAAGMNGVTLDVVPYGIPVCISTHLSDPLWIHEHNSLIYTPENQTQFKGLLLEASLGKYPLDKYAENAKDDLWKYAKPIEESAPIWEERLVNFIESKE